MLDSLIVSLAKEAIAENADGVEEVAVGGLTSVIPSIFVL